MKQLKFRVFDKISNKMADAIELIDFTTEEVKIAYKVSDLNVHPYTYWRKFSEVEIMPDIDIKDKNNRDIYKSDIIQFSDKAEWYKYDLFHFCFNSLKDGLTSKQWLEQQKYERRIVKIPEDYEYLLSREIQEYWEVIGNIYENPELLEKL